MTFIVPDHSFEQRRGWIFSYINSYSSCNMSRTRASVSSQVPNTKKQMKARGRRPSTFICLFDVLEPVMKHEARVLDMFSQMKQ